MITEKTIKYFSMFSGIGGFEHGIEKANTQTDFECVGYSEIDKYAVSIYEKHYPNHINYGDATRIRTSELPDFDLLVGGFPCQAFSTAGYQRGFEETRGTLFFEIARVLKDKRPRYFLLENVRGLLGHDKGKTFQVILGVLADLGYYVQWTVLNSKNYGVPQNRERVFIEGYLRAECGLEVLPIRGKSDAHTEQETMRTLTDTNNSLQPYIHIVGNVSPTGHYSGDVFSTNGISRTLCATDYKRGTKILETSNSKKVETASNLKVRRLTPKECERLQSFPDDWTKYGKDGELISNTQRYKCLGNAVTTNVIAAIIEEMFP